MSAGDTDPSFRNLHPSHQLSLFPSFDDRLCGRFDIHNRPLTNPLTGDTAKTDDVNRLGAHARDDDEDLR